MQNCYFEKTNKSIKKLNKKDFVEIMCNQKDLEIYFPSASVKSK